jgi:hypothetical protein
LKEEALDRTLRRTRFGRGYGPVVRQTAEWMNEVLGFVPVYWNKKGSNGVAKEKVSWITLRRFEDTG